MIVIKTPRGAVVQGKNGKARLEWNPDFGKTRSAAFNRAQSFIDSEVLRGCAKYVPLRTGTLVKSGTLGTVVGSGEVKYIAPYARKQYYENKGGGADKNRGRLWFERWKADRKEEVIAKARQLSGADRKER